MVSKWLNCGRFGALLQHRLISSSAADICRKSTLICFDAISMLCLTLLYEGPYRSGDARYLDRDSAW
jgi:hypothetical protein